MTYELVINEGDGEELVATGSIEKMYQLKADLQEDQVLDGRDAADYRVVAA
jgi:hypothetical protein